MDETSVLTQLFVTSWRIGREQLRLQAKTLKSLYDAAQAANDALPKIPPIRLDQMSESDVEVLKQWWNDEGTARGARDAYASALIFFVDNLLKATLRFYKTIPNVIQVFKQGVNGIPTPRIFRYAGNNIRHYDEWRAPAEQIPKADQAYEAVKAIATVVGRPVPPKEELSVMASNWAWPIVFAVGSGTFEGFICKVRECMDELLVNAGMETDPLVLEEYGKEQ